MLTNSQNKVSRTVTKLDEITLNKHSATLSQVHAALDKAKMSAMKIIARTIRLHLVQLMQRRTNYVPILSSYVGV